MIRLSFGSIRWLVGAAFLLVSTCQLGCKSRCRPGTVLQEGRCIVPASGQHAVATNPADAADPQIDGARGEIGGAQVPTGVAGTRSQGIDAGVNLPGSAGAASSAADGGQNGSRPAQTKSADAGCMPTPELCDGRDNDCDGMSDEQVANKCWVDFDADGFAASSAEVVESCDACGPMQTPTEPSSSEKTDCNDSDETSSPNATDICGDNIDNDCDGMIDDESNNVCGGPCTMQLAGKPGAPCNNGLKGACARMGTYECQPDHTLKCSAELAEGTAEECGDNSDNDCDGVIDNDCVMNKCGGWTQLSPDRDMPCSTGSGSCRATGRFECSGTDQTVCVVEPKTPNGCGGCSPLSNLGDRCTATCSTGGQYVCDGTDNTRCNATARPMNGCGGCNQLAHEPNSPCTGECNSRGAYRCVAGRNDQTECVVTSSAMRNSCGGCGRDPAGISAGDRCAAGMNSCAVIGTYQCTGSGDSAALACSAMAQAPSNGCGGCIGPSKGTSCIATDANGNSVDGIYVCDGELTYCEPRT